MPVIWLQYTNKESGGRIPVMVEWEWNVLRLKEEITSQLCRTPETLIFSGRVMCNQCKLSDLLISEFSTVYCVLANPHRSYTHGHRVHRSLPSPRRDRYMGIDLPDIHVEVDNESYVRMRSREPYYEHMRSVEARPERYVAKTGSTLSEHFYETLEQFSFHSSHQRNEMKATRIHFSIFCGDVCKDVTQGKLRVRCYDCKSNQFDLFRDPSCWDDVTGESIRGTCCSCRCEKARAEFYFKCVNHSQLESITTPLKQVKLKDCNS